MILWFICYWDIWLIMGYFRVYGGSKMVIICIEMFVKDYSIKVDIRVKEIVRGE